MTEKELTSMTFEEVVRFALERDRAASDAEQRVELLASELRLMRHKRFGASSERFVAGQTSIDFDDEVEAVAEEAAAETVTVTYSRRKPAKKKVRSLDDSDLEEVFEDAELPEDRRVCACCGGELHDMGHDCRTTFETVPARHYKRTVRIHKYACRACERAGRPQRIVRADAKPSLLPGSFASASAVSHIMADKFVRHIPLDRQEKSMAYDGVFLSKQTMSNWLVECTESYLAPLYDLMREDLVSCEVVHADETPVKILHPPGYEGKKAKKKKGAGKNKGHTPDSCYMWAYRTAPYYEHRIAIYDHQPTRSGSCPRAFLAGFKGYLQTDGYDGYNAVPDAVRVGCWAHARRKFHDALVGLPEKTGDYALALEGLAKCDDLFDLERKFAGMTPEERHAARLEESAPLVEDMRKWAKEKKPETRPKSLVGKALNYLEGEWPTLTVFLEDGRVELSNNAAERSVRPVAVGRKNWLFSNTMGGAKTSATILSIVETAKINGLNPEAYLRFLLETVPSSSLSELPSLLPWGSGVPESVKARERKSASAS